MCVYIIGNTFFTATLLTLHIHHCFLTMDKQQCDYKARSELTSICKISLQLSQWVQDKYMYTVATE